MYLIIVKEQCRLKLERDHWIWINRSKFGDLPLKFGTFPTDCYPYDGRMVRSDLKSKFDRSLCCPVAGSRREHPYLCEGSTPIFVPCLLDTQEMGFGGHSSITSRNTSIMGKTLLSIELMDCQLPVVYTCTPSDLVKEVILDKVWVKYWEYRSWITFN
jgi:hypothetical protein